MQKEFEGKTVIVTGSSSGIGEAIAILFAHKGAMVTLCGRDQNRLQQAQVKCREAGGTGSQDKYIAVRGDVSEASVREEIVKKTIDKFGHMDVLVCNHGIFSGISPGLDESEDSFDKTMNTNVKSVYFLIQKAIPHLEKTKGCIVNFSSIRSTVPGQTKIPYAMSKAALDHMTRCLALALAPKGIRVNAINPTQVMTRMFPDSTYARNFAASHPLHARASTAGEQAEAVVFLASEKKASFITGECLKVDGAITLNVVPE